AMDPYSVDAFREMCARPVQRELTIGLCEGAFAQERFPNIPAVPLNPLHQPEAIQMIEAWLATNQLSEQLIETLHRRSRGQPGLMIDWMHLLADRGLLRNRGGTLVVAGDTPAYDDQEIAVERVKALWPDAARLLEVVCVAGDSIDGAVLNAVLPNVSKEAY